MFLLMAIISLIIFIIHWIKISSNIISNTFYKLAQDKFIRTVVDYIARYYVLLGGCDVLCFTAGIGENSKGVRAEIVEKLACLGFKLDAQANDVRGEFRKISADDSSSLIYILPTDEELAVNSRSKSAKLRVAERI